jgi:hypothetical protein
MAILRVPASWLTGIAGHFPLDVQPGVCIGILILLLWLLTVARRSAWNALVRVACLMTDFAVGLLLLPEFAWTRARRAHGEAPGTLAVVGGRVADRALDTAADAYDAHPLMKFRWALPAVLIVLLLIGSGFDYWLIHQSPPSRATLDAGDVWRCWVEFNNWTRGIVTRHPAPARISHVQTHARKR